MEILLTVYNHFYKRGILLEAIIVITQPGYISLYTFVLRSVNLVTFQTVCI